MRFSNEIMESLVESISFYTLIFKIKSIFNYQPLFDNKEGEIKVGDILIYTKKTPTPTRKIKEA